MLLLCVDPDNLSNLNSAAQWETHQLNVKSTIPPSILRLFLTFSHSLAFPIYFSFLSVIIMRAAANVITKGWGWVCVCVWVGGCLIAVHAQQNATLKSYYQKREHFGRYTVEGSSRHMFVETGTTSQVVIINHHQEELSKREAGHALTGVAMETSPHTGKCVFTETLKIRSCIFILHS